jgi:imidazolonepropionase-like amidohydrolase
MLALQASPMLLKSRLFVTTLALWFVFFATGRTQVEERHLALVGGTVLTSPAERAIKNGVVVVRGSRIVAVGSKVAVAVPAGAEILDCSGLTIAAGFWNSHVHFMERKWADAAKIPAAELADALQGMLTRYGFTSVFDLGSSWDNTRRLRDRVQSGEIPGPRIRSTGEFLVPKGGSARDFVFDIRGAMHISTPELTEPAEAAAAAKMLIDAGVDGIKLYVSTAFQPILALPDGVIDAAVKVAHGRGKPVFAHPSTREGLMAALRGGADVLVHTTPYGGDWDDPMIDVMKKRGVALIPTLQLWEYELRHDRGPVRARLAALATEQLEKWNRVGGIVLFGTDVGYHGHYDPAGEYMLMAEAGMSGREILASLTTAPAEQFGESSRLGRVAPGYLADLVVLRDDPIQNVRAFADVRYTIRDGRIIFGH